MRLRFIVQVGGAVLSVAYTAANLWFSTITIWPNTDWRFQAVIGFLIFVGCMVWMVCDKQTQINKLVLGRPEMALGNRANASLIDNKPISEYQIKYNLSYRNIGAKSAYQARIRVGFAPIDKPQDFAPFPDEDSVNPIEPVSSNEFGRTIFMKQKYTTDSNGKVTLVGPEGWLIYCSVRYSDSLVNGKIYEEERWFEYKIGGNLAHASLKQKIMLEPFVKSKFVTP